MEIEDAVQEKNAKTQIEFTSEDKIWNQDGNIYRLRDNTVRSLKLANAVYSLGCDMFGFFLEKEFDEFAFEHKLYGLETDFINRVLKTYKASKGNLGVLLNGVKGTGKTVTAKIICNKLNMPVILVPTAINHCQFFLNGIPQDIVIFIDEFEKVFKKNDDSGADLLTIMDGALNSEFRRTFMLTTNNLYVNENLIQRPGRIRYLKPFGDLHQSVIEEIINDRLKYKKYKQDLLTFISGLEIITVDIVNAIIDEVNIHNESPNMFKDVFNVKKLAGKYNIYVINESDGTKTELMNSVQIYPRRMDGSGSEDDVVGHRFEAGQKPLGTIVAVVGKNMYRIQSDIDEKKIKRLAKKIQSDGPEEPGESRKKALIKSIKAEMPPSFVIKIEDADVMNWKYKSGAAVNEFGFY